MGRQTLQNKKCTSMGPVGDTLCCAAQYLHTYLGQRTVPFILNISRGHS